MSKLTQKFKEVEKVIKEKVKDGVILELTDLEANLLYLILGKTSGNSLYELYKELHDIYGPWDWDNPIEGNEYKIIDLSKLETYIYKKNKEK